MTVRNIGLYVPRGLRLQYTDMKPRSVRCSDFDCDLLRISYQIYEKSPGYERSGGFEKRRFAMLDFAPRKKGKEFLKQT